MSNGSKFVSTRSLALTRAEVLGARQEWPAHLPGWVVSPSAYKHGCRCEGCTKVGRRYEHEYKVRTGRASGRRPFHPLVASLRRQEQQRRRALAAYRAKRSGTTLDHERSIIDTECGPLPGDPA